ncbi:ECF transporter S component [Lactobacillus helveticus]|uniref:ECF transporter S component n=1 Tax=Lactobacillus helveticus TaxID=1587 RepID=UPI00081A4786|nr:ECF transporter S component [Lactobacillus helveticus]ANZ56208.1 ECF transporter S component [Lactobacillus helveticus]AQY54320.1 ECF transporter S component [Lactobacillus helveticus]MBU6034215.1 ECF transporter S component [Lactobacillus helveticus]MBW1219257.1 ECF transporter S component [Lactobacillus helveticus]MDY0875921.1 ECF transporter S component [Lactobacillus helveticus]
MVTGRVQIRQIALMAMLTAMCVVLRIFKVIPIPNVQPVTDILMIVTLTLGIGSGILLAALTMFISNIYLGFGIWTIPQILAYVGCVLTIALLAKVLPIQNHFWMQLALATFLGWEYGFLVDLGMTIFGGFPAFIAYLVSSFAFDTYHAIGNFAFYLVLYKPVTLALKKYQRRCI